MNKNKITQCLKALSEKLEKEEFKELVNVRYEKGKLLNPRCDPIFKTLFTHNSEESNYALKCFLSAVLGRKIAEVTLQPTELPKESSTDKDALFDVSCRFADSEEYFDVEMQGRNSYDSYDNRAEYYAAHLLNHFIDPFAFYGQSLETSASARLADLRADVTKIPSTAATTSNAATHRTYSTIVWPILPHFRMQ